MVLGFADSPYSRTLPKAPKGGVAVSGRNPIQAVPQLQGAVVPLPALLQAAAGLGSLSLSTADTVNTVRRVPLLVDRRQAVLPHAVAGGAARGARGLDHGGDG